MGMDGLSSLMTLIGPVRNWLEFLRAGKTQDLQRRKEAIDALHNALCETQIYVSELRSGNGNKNTQHELARHWHKASAALDGIDDELSHLCMLKGQYWTEPNVWDDERIVKAGIELNKITEDIRQLKKLN